MLLLRNISNYVCEHDLQQLASEIISYTHDALQNTSFETETTEARIIPLYVDLPLITLDGSETQNLIEIGGEDSNLLTEIMEQSMQQLNMIPTSKEAITSLKKLETSNDEMKANMCSICMEGFEEDFGDIAAMPCNHFYHHNCIVTWLETNHTCPLCRFPMPTE